MRLQNTLSSDSKTRFIWLASYTEQILFKFKPVKRHTQAGSVVQHRDGRDTSTYGLHTRRWNASQCMEEALRFGSLAVDSDITFECYNCYIEDISNNIIWMDRTNCLPRSSYLHTTVSSLSVNGEQCWVSLRSALRIKELILYPEERLVIFATSFIIRCPV